MSLVMNKAKGLSHARRAKHALTSIATKFSRTLMAGENPGTSKVARCTRGTPIQLIARRSSCSGWLMDSMCIAIRLVHGGGMELIIAVARLSPFLCRDFVSARDLWSEGA